MERFGNGRVALMDDRDTAERLGWTLRKRSTPEPEFLLSPVTGDPRREAWIARTRPSLGGGPAELWEGRPESQGWTYLSQAQGLLPYLERLDRWGTAPGDVVGISGLGRVGGTAAAALSTVPSAVSGIRTLLIHDGDAANQARWAAELASVARWQEQETLPTVVSVSQADMLARCDIFLFAAAKDVPPLGTAGDVRLPQFAPNRPILQEALAAAREARYAGLFCVISDPVEVLAQAAFHDSNTDAAGVFHGQGLAPERIAGLALGVMWGRALAVARERGQGDRVARCGAAFGPHSTEVLAYDDPAHPDLELSAAMSEAARRGNYRIRDLGFFPYIGPALSSIVTALPRLLARQEILASPLVDGIYFGTPTHWDWGLIPSPRALAPQVQETVTQLHARHRALLQGLALYKGE